MSMFEGAMEEWIAEQTFNESNPRRREMLTKGLGHGTVEFLRKIWYPVIGNFNHLYAEWEVRDLNNRYRYLDLAYMPGGAKGCIEIHGYASHARDVEAWRFKDLCMKQAMLSLDRWLFLPVAYLSIVEDPSLCKQLVLSFVGVFVSQPVSTSMHWTEAETIRFARRLLRPFTTTELSFHLQYSEKHTRRILQRLADQGVLVNVEEKKRYRTWQLRDGNAAVQSSKTLSIAELR
ncbi:transcriptional regulator [Paenibacillus sp. HB172176]|uniref:transcriptional regulator n=1 Tax=Paenibacillus sp. HB172176 TaxID=2493690 RepID=UPI0014391A01|nr:transcriptional regulator [Paenibacillus sp. HB172176]